MAALIGKTIKVTLAAEDSEGNFFKVSAEIPVPRLTDPEPFEMLREQLNDRISQAKAEPEQV